MLSFEQKLRNYALLGLRHGLGMDQVLRPLYLDCYEDENLGDFVGVVSEEAYKMGVETVDPVYRNVRLERAQYLHAKEARKNYVPFWVTARAQEIVWRDGARLALCGNGGLGVLDDVDPKYPSGMRSAYFAANEPFTSRRMAMLQPWSILSVPTRAWAAKLGVSTDELWEILFAITGADQADPLAYARGVSDALHKRCKLLDGLQIRALHFIGRGTDLVVTLSERARWLGGRKQAADGTWFGPNGGSYECFTTPDWRGVFGVVRLTKPTVIGGQVVDGLTLRFKEGEIVEFDAAKGRETFAALIAKDAGAKRSGEIALVGLDSPIAKLDRLLFSTMEDENAADHLAIGGPYLAAIAGGNDLSQEELAAIGFNKSVVHHDMMISDAKMNVYALDVNGRIIAPLQAEGCWLPPFDCAA